MVVIETEGNVMIAAGFVVTAPGKDFGDFGDDELRSR